MDRLSKLCETGLADPRSAVAMFLLVCLRRSRSRKLGTQMLLKVMHPDCLTFSQTGDGSTLPRPNSRPRVRVYLPWDRLVRLNGVGWGWVGWGGIGWGEM